MIEQLAYQTLGLCVRGTPAFLIGYPRKERAEVRIVKRIVGAPPYTVFAEVVDALLLLRAKWRSILT